MGTKKNLNTPINSVVLEDALMIQDPVIVCISKPLGYYFEETIGFDVKATLARRHNKRILRKGYSVPRHF